LASFVEFTIEQNANFNTVLDLKDAGNNILNLSGYQAAAQMRKSYYSSTAIDFTVELTNPTGGQITISMTAATTSEIIPGRYVYDVLITDPQGIKTRVIEGIVTVLPSVTR
jgi:hypothetical protein